MRPGEWQAPVAPVAPVAPASPSRPVWPLILGILLFAAGAGAGSVALIKMNQARSAGGGATGAQAPSVPHAPGVQQAATPEGPTGPGAMLGRNPVPPPGPPVTATNKGPDGIAPSVLMGPGGQAPSGPSVVSSPGTPDLPAGPSPLQQTPPQPRPGQSPLQQPNRAMPQAPPAPPDNSDFDRYLRWMQFVENERSGLRAQGETEAFRTVEGFYQIMLGLADPDSNDAAMERQFQQSLQLQIRRTVAAIQLFRTNIMRTRPPVPSDCKALDQYYLSAVSQEGVQTAALLDALSRRDIGAIRRVGKTGVAKIDRDLGMANRKLEEVYRQRGLNQQFQIETGGNSSMLGGLIGLGM